MTFWHYGPGSRLVWALMSRTLCLLKCFNVHGPRRKKKAGGPTNGVGAPARPTRSAFHGAVEKLRNRETTIRLQDVLRQAGRHELGDVLLGLLKRLQVSVDHVAGVV